MLTRPRSLLLAGLSLFVLALGVIALQSFGTSPVTRAFYFWKTQWVASPAMLAGLADHDVRQLYMRFFDVEWDELHRTTRPVSPLRVSAPLPAQVEIVPVVYLVNTVFLKIRYEDVEPLAENVWHKVNAMAGEQGVTFRQLQIDCDWSDSSRRNYFHFADLLSRRLKQENKIVSATIRLHQVKYAERTGIPPVSRGMLMFYNFGRIQADSQRSSIFNREDAARYASFIAGYPLKLDVVLPLFSWVVHSRDGKVLGLLEKLDTADLDGNDGFRKLSTRRYTATRSFFFRGRYFMSGDLLLVEATTPNIAQQAATLARQGAGWHKHYDTVALFDLDERHFKTYAHTDIKNIFSRF